MEKKTDFEISDCNPLKASHLVKIGGSLRVDGKKHYVYTKWLNNKLSDQDFEVSKQDVIKKSVKALGFNFLNDYGLPNNFNLKDSKLADVLRGERDLQEQPMPFTDQMFESFMHSKKMPINSFIITESNTGSAKKTYNQLFISKHDDKDCLFRLAITYHPKYIGDFSISMTMLVGGKDWLPLYRYDSDGGDHSNWIKDGEVLTNPEIIKTPHLHINNQKTQVYFAHNVAHTDAQELTRIKGLLESGELDRSDHMMAALKCLEAHGLLNINGGINNYDVTKPHIPFIDYNNVKYNVACTKDITNIFEKGAKHNDNCTSERTY